MNWRTVAWICNIYAIVPFLLVFMLPESPAWLIVKGRKTEARNSLNWFNKYQPSLKNKAETYAQLQFEYLVKEQEDKERSKHQNHGLMAKIKEFIKPTGYKPLLILLGLFVFQQFSGIYITLFYSITFFQVNIS